MRLGKTAFSLAVGALVGLATGCGSQDGPGAGAANGSSTGGSSGAPSGSGSGSGSSGGTSSGSTSSTSSSGGSGSGSGSGSGGGASGGDAGTSGSSGGSSGSSSSSGSGSGSSSGGGADAGTATTPACPMPTGAAVTLTASGTSSVISNGIVTVTVDGAGQMTQLTQGGTNFMGSGDTMYVSESGGTTYYAIAASSHTVVTQTPDLVELAFLDTSGGNHDMDWELHYVVRRGVSGFYYFLVTKVGTSTHPNPATLTELRTVQRFDASLLSNGYSGERHGQLPTAAQNATFLTATQIQDSTYSLTMAPNPLVGASSLPGVVGQHYDDGPVFTKYDWASYRTEDLAHGLYGNGHGVWLLSPSWEFYTGGPVKQELMVHHENLILNMYHGGHFGSATTAASPATWQKLYGPNLVYVNGGSDAQVIADALAQGATERAQWPYCWMNNVLYPAASKRGTVTGQVAEAHGQSVAGAMVVLAGAGDLIDQGYDYMFWAQADATGHFTIPGVRPGSYSVHVYATQGLVVDDPTHGEVAGMANVAAGMNDLGMLTWSPPFHAKAMWSIGVSDQTSGEFRFDPAVPAGIDNTAHRTGRMYGPSATSGVWTVPPATTTYTIGTSTPQTDWYFAQSVNGAWTVNFNVAAVPAGGAFLTVGLAGATRSPTLAVAVNGHSVLTQTFGNDAGLYRSALQGGRFQMLTATVPAADLRAGANAATFTISNATGGAGIYYDVVKMESD